MSDATPKKRGRPPVAHPRDKTISAAVTADDLVEVDAARGSLSRSEWLLGLVRAALAR